MRTRRSQSSSDPVSPAATSGHTPVLLHEALHLLEVHPDDIVVDATLGGAGHARAIAQLLGERGVLVGFDLDADAIERARNALADAKPTVHLVQANFRDMLQELQKLGISRVTKVLFDLGWSSYQLNSGRGFSFSGEAADEPLLMTYAKSAEPLALTAAQAINNWSESSLADVIWGFGEERYARRIAKAIVAERARRPIGTAGELSELVKQAVPAPARRGKLHPATKTFQALRIAVNDELGALRDGLAGAWSLLAPGGRMAVISFHSLEDRAVKQNFAGVEKAGEGKRITKKPIAPAREEVVRNPRARSAKLRVVEKSL